MPELLSARNPRVAELRRLVHRHRERVTTGKFVVDGPRLLAEAVDAGVELADVFVEPGVEPGVVVNAPVWTVGEGVLTKMGSVVTPQGVMATARIPPTGPLEDGDFVVEMAGVADPGNAGTIVRSAVAAGAQAVVFGPGSVDPWNPKTVRAAAGALFRTPLAVAAPVGFRVGTDPHRGDPCDRVDLTGPLTLVVGNESHGLDESAADRWVCIPTAASVESLNVASATAVLCFEIARQRRQKAAAFQPAGKDQ
ncbi:TrmH family RNA methyltransferase [Candidatus Poriferisocius sp.]|uniref:TrmH family RNA methyltransferase n=1 Tax=Candidatus Poriferisocius sp. TaxID=3101276 RepID=UPI003B0236F6